VRFPTVSLITLGEQKEYAGRVAFCKNFFAIAGIDTSTIEYRDNGGDKNKATLAVLCASDERYLAEANTACSNINCEHLWLAGNNPKVTNALDKDVITENIHLRSNRVEILDKALTLLGAA